MSKIISKASPVTELLNKQLANWSVLDIKLSNYHWYVKGETFFSLHVKFEELFSEAALYLDRIAERILSLRGEPLATMKEHLANASINEAAGGETAAQMVKQLVDDFELLSKELTRDRDR
jgi:starvation-inducible DNA-binding protein